MKNVKSITCIGLMALALMAGCDDGTKDKKSKDDLSTGDKAAYSAGGLTFTMVYIEGGMTVPRGESDDDTAQVDDPYWIAETEVTYELWDMVYTWAASNGYSFATGEMGSWSGATNQHPVVSINWREAMVWCNALTEWYNSLKGTSYACAYYTDSERTIPIRSADDLVYAGDPAAGSQDSPWRLFDADGFRMPLWDEWELAARYQGTDQTNAVTDTIYGIDFSDPEDGLYWTKGNSVSGADSNLTTESAVYAVYGASGTALVKSKEPNALGLYDMSGNAAEWSSSIYSSTEYTRVIRGSSWNSVAADMDLGILSYDYPYNEAFDVGLRVVRGE